MERGEGAESNMTKEILTWATGGWERSDTEIQMEKMCTGYSIAESRGREKTIAWQPFIYLFELTKTASAIYLLRAKFNCIVTIREWDLLI